MSKELNEETTETPVVAKKKSIEFKYRVVSIEKTETPTGMPGDNWYKYIIGQGTSKIEGFKAGTLKEVTEHVDTFTEDLNGRAKSGSTAYAARKKKMNPPVAAKTEAATTTEAAPTTTPSS